MSKSELVIGKSLYNIQDYSDTELFDILDLNDPSDRELEAKILMMIHKYETTSSKSGGKLAKFFQDIYNHFFENNGDQESDDQESDDQESDDQ